MRVVSRCFRVLLASGVLVLGVAVLAALSPSAAAASTVHGGPSIICPGAAAPPCCSPIVAIPANAVTCCPVPTIAGCCNPASGTNCCTTTPCPAGLTIVVNPSTVSEGTNTNITGALTGATVASQKVDLYERPAGQSTFTDVAQTQTSATGTYQFVRAVQTNTQWYTKAAGLQSPAESETVLAAIALHSSSIHPKAGARVMLSATVAPSHAGERVLLQRLRGGKWVTIARPKLSARSAFRVAEKLPARRASMRFRVMLAADARNARSVSSAVALTSR
ncbi:MAG TPA: hypothetical protein VG295_07545 [Solirubrobacteraceae bacterium]|nr:hypothetical protein [Solirubrobacteraceae bacterium]